MTITSPAGSAGVDGSSKYKVVSADAHILEPPHIWETWLPAELQDRAPEAGQGLGRRRRLAVRGRRPSPTPSA